MQEENTRHRSLLVDGYSAAIEFANRHFTLAKWLIKKEHDIFYRIEKMMLIILLISVMALLTLHFMPRWLAITLSVLFAQRVLEFIIVYSRNFIFNKGRIFTDFKDPRQQGEWLIMTVTLSLIQLVVIFALWYRLLGLHSASAFVGDMTVLNSLYFSLVTFLTVGFGDIVPLSGLAKALVILQSCLTFFTLVIVMNGLISIHFRNKS